jgi:hypothetical protein
MGLAPLPDGFDGKANLYSELGMSSLKAIELLMTLEERYLAAVLDGLKKTPVIWLPDSQHAAELAAAPPLEALPPLRPDRVAYSRPAPPANPRVCRFCTRTFALSSIGRSAAIGFAPKTDFRRPLIRPLIFRFSTCL